MRLSQSLTVASSSDALARVSMPLAFLIMAHKNPGQVARLFHAIHRPDDLVLLHMDRRADAALHQLARDLARQHANVIVLKSRKIVWGGFAAAQVQLDGMATALRANPHWHHFINLSGQDFPVKRLEQLEDHLRAAPDSNYVSWFDPIAQPLWRNARERVERYYLEWPWLDRVFRIPGAGRRVRKLLTGRNPLPYVPFVKRKPPPFHYYGGSNYVVLSRAACEHFVSDAQARRITTWLRHTLHPDEIMAQTVLLNSPLAPSVVNTSLHAIDFPVDSPHPRTYRSEDLDRLLQSPKFFARKFDGAADPQILERLERHLELTHS